MARIILLALLALPAFALDAALSRSWKISVAAMAAATAADAATSYGRPELNPVLGQQFGGRGIAIKAGVLFGTVWAEHRLLRKHPRFAKPFTIFNFAIAGTHGSVAVVNSRH